MKKKKRNPQACAIYRVHAHAADPDLSRFTDDEAVKTVDLLRGFGLRNPRIEEDGVWLDFTQPTPHTIHIQKQSIDFSDGRPNHFILELQIGDMMRYIKQMWEGDIKLFGNEDFNFMCWHIATRHGIKVLNYAPPRDQQGPVIF